tara:strand:- start:47 stop:187 length:141 start_codon:yes stop_codon:yes gene_type:complete
VVAEDVPEVVQPEEQPSVEVTKADVSMAEAEVMQSAPVPVLVVVAN